MPLKDGMQGIFYYYRSNLEKEMDFKTKGIERSILLLSVLVGTTVVFFTTLSDYTLNGVLRGPVEVLLGLFFLFVVGFASVWTIYGVVMFIVKGFSDPSEVSQDFKSLERLVEVSPKYHPLPEEEKPKEQKPLLPWKKQIENTRSAMSKIRIRLIDKAKQKKLFKRTGGVRIIKFNCKYCGQKITVPLVHAGKKGQCLKCNNILVIPSVKKVKLALAKSNLSVNTRLSRPTFVSKAKVEAEELAKTKVWEAIHAEIVAKSPLARTNTEIKESNRAEIERKTSAKNKSQRELQVIAQSVLERIESARTQAEAKIKSEAEIKSKEMAQSLEKFQTETEARIMAEVLKKTEPAANAEAEMTAKLKSQTNNNAVTAAAKSKTTTNAEALKTIQPGPGPQAGEFNIFEVIQAVKKNAMASAV